VILAALIPVLTPAQVVYAQTGDPADDFVITVKTDYAGTSGSTQFTIPTYPGKTYNYNVDCDNDAATKPARRPAALPTATPPWARTLCVSKIILAWAPASRAFISMLPETC
jgi:hypothetical protein